MREYFFEDLTLVRRVLKVTLYGESPAPEDDYLRAEVKATVGPLSRVLEKEGVELVSTTEQSNCVPCDLAHLKDGHYWYRGAYINGVTKEISWGGWEPVLVAPTQIRGKLRRLVAARHWSERLDRLQEQPEMHQFQRLIPPRS